MDSEYCMYAIIYLTKSYTIIRKVKRSNDDNTCMGGYWEDFRICLARTSVLTWELPTY